MPKLLYLVTEDWAFCQHFLPMARAAHAAGFDVTIATRVRDHAERLAAAGCRVISLENERRSLGPLEIVRSVVRMAKIVRAEQPDVVHCIALRMVVLGGLAAKFAGARSLVLAPTGLGHLWISNGVIEKLGRVCVRWIVSMLRGKNAHFLFENSDDPTEFGLDPISREVTIVGGAGIDPKEFPNSPDPSSRPVRVAVVSRMIIPKGIKEAVEAIRLARSKGVDVELHLFGAPDPSNRTTYTEADLETWANNDGVTWHGPTKNTAAVWRDHHIAMLLSYREGLPRALVEASASGRPMIATDVTGCRQVVRNGIEGILVSRDDIAGIAAAVTRLVSDAPLRARMGELSHQRFLAYFTEDAVVATVTQLYRNLRSDFGTALCDSGSIS